MTVLGEAPTWKLLNRHGLGGSRGRAIRICFSVVPLHTREWPQDEQLFAAQVLACSRVEEVPSPGGDQRFFTSNCVPA